MAGARIKYVVEEVYGRYVGIGLNGREFYCNTIPLPSKAEAEADLRATCYSAWGDSIEMAQEYHIPLAYELAITVNKLFGGEEVDLSWIRIARHPREKFWRAILLMRAIPRGRVTTYGELARAVGTSPRAAGNYASRNPFPLIVPCHRVIRSDMRIGGYSYGPILKASLLISEGVRVDLDTGKVDPSRVMRSEELLSIEEVRNLVGYHQTRLRI